MKLPNCLSVFIVSSASVAQSPYVNFVWEASDGGAWTRHAITTDRSNIQLRLLAEWSGGLDGEYFGGVNFDAIISNTASNDTVLHAVRPSPFDFLGQVLASQRFGDTIKIDDLNDVLPPGNGAGWIEISQPLPGLGGLVDTSNPAMIFSCSLICDGTPGTRVVSMIAQTNPRGGPETAVVYTRFGQVIRVVATIEPVDIRYIPAPSIGVFAASSLCCFFRRHR